jgi:hypothetical protein
MKDKFLELIESQNGGLKTQKSYDIDQQNVDQSQSAIQQSIGSPILEKVLPKCGSKYSRAYE